MAEKSGTQKESIMREMEEKTEITIERGMEIKAKGNTGVRVPQAHPLQK